MVKFALKKKTDNWKKCVLFLSQAVFLIPTLLRNILSGSVIVINPKATVWLHPHSIHIQHTQLCL